MLKTFNVDKYACLKCSTMLDRASTAGGRGPQEGDISICIRCGHIMQFVEDKELSVPERISVLYDKDSMDETAVEGIIIGVRDVDIEDLKRNMSPSEYIKMKSISMRFAQGFFNKNGHYASELFKEL